ncbi:MULTISPECIES: SAM-dependent methyltransferase [Rhodobacterales]|uniref:class I SAM-dependent methyltransferase n=1 Tax=Roseobacter sp. N2S TaxID=2663844 RepID=UPI0028647A2B|nr:MULTISPECIES: SAM-dependent methyltransferase [Rhodobacterales]MDR6265190.1 SAM-dependent MidA family methyltransferase [Roseobacter sp. N2S]
MTPLHDILLRQIGRLGPMSISEFMTQCLYHPEHGYYTQAKPLGRAGDFITAPEISQMFGEMIGLCLAQNWLDQGAPERFCLAELGPGSGQLMADILRATKSVPGFHAAAQLYLCEVNPHLKAQQAERLASFAPHWIASTTDLPALPLFLVANEFLDCLPINQFIATDSGWDEQIVASHEGQLCFARRAAGAVESELPKDATTGTVIELCPAANAIVQDIATSITRHGGLALICDYGDTGGGDTLQAIRAHEKMDPLDHVGQADLTAHVNFAALKDALVNVQTAGPTPQGAFLERLGITTRAQTLAQNLSGAALENHITAHHRLTHPDEMGELFKVMAILPRDGVAPAGFI